MRVVWCGGIGPHVFRACSDGEQAVIEVLTGSDALGKETWHDTMGLMDDALKDALVKVLAINLYRSQAGGGKHDDGNARKTKGHAGRRGPGLQPAASADA